MYGYPKANELDYLQGDAVPNFKGTCALTSIANLLTQAGMPTGEGEVVQRAIANGWAVSEADGAIAGCYIADSGRGKVSDKARFVGIEDFRLPANVAGAYAIHTLEPLKLWDENVDRVGNADDMYPERIAGNSGESRRWRHGDSAANDKVFETRRKGRIQHT